MLPADPPEGDTVLEVRDYKVWFPIRKGLLKRTVGYVKAVDGVSFKIPAGRTLALVGESGSGKTTVGKAILQLLRNNAVISGTALLQGQPLETLNGEALRTARRAAQIVFQDPFASLNPRMRVSEILEEGVASLRPDVTPAERTERVAALLEKVGLRRDAMLRYPHEFSGGQRQRLAIARALAVEPRVDRRRRAHVGAGRFGAGADPQPSEAVAAGAGRRRTFSSRTTSASSNTWRTRSPS